MIIKPAQSKTVTERIVGQKRQILDDFYKLSSGKKEEKKDDNGTSPNTHGK